KDVGAEVANRTPFEALRPMGRDIFRRCVQTVRYRTVPGFRPEAGPKIVGTATKQQIEALTLYLGDGRRPGRSSVGCRPSAMGVVAVCVRSAGRDHAVQRDMCEDSDLSHLVSASAAFTSHILMCECDLMRTR